MSDMGIGEIIVVLLVIVVPPILLIRQLRQDKQEWRGVVCFLAVVVLLGAISYSNTITHIPSESPCWEYNTNIEQINTWLESNHEPLELMACTASGEFEFLEPVKTPCWTFNNPQ